jgi:hypothetical protein
MLTNSAGEFVAVAVAVNDQVVRMVEMLTKLSR